MDTVIISAWMTRIQDLLVEFLSKPNDESEAALLTMMNQYRQAFHEEYTSLC